VVLFFFDCFSLAIPWPLRDYRH